MTTDPQQLADDTLQDIEFYTAEARHAVLNWDADRFRRALDNIAQRIDTWREGPRS